ncbi:PREDICTED: uncharacterized protein LOC105563189 [Vollenhovia emeryi]|uniref:uncharacterized protein LOC105563189 n=1 Tax=Vollenhovia emeryi TaxID=411798 RepID=UPI0005F461AB|nr:PREDICTED: uncharacterized protein LOC105563189 [Vollenhovia emeryi]
MEPSRDRYYDISKRYLALVGQWPYQKSKESLFFLMLILFFDVNVLVTQAARFFVCDNMQCIFETLPPHLLAAIIPVKIFTYQFNSRKIKHLTDRLFVDWDLLESEKERDIMRKYAENGRWYVLIYSSYVYISTVSFTTTSLAPRILDVVFPLNVSRPIMLPYPAYYFVDDNQYFYYIFLHMIICATICLTGLIAHDCMFFTYIEHICGLFAVVRYRFEHVSHKRSNTEKGMIDCPDYLYYKNVVISIHAHRKALQFVKILEDTFSISFAVQLLLITLCLSITLVQQDLTFLAFKLSTQLHDSAEAMRYFVFIMAQLFHLFCFSFQGQKLINHSLGTRDNIYHSLWYKIPVKEQRLLLFVMRKSIEASAFTAGKIYVFSLENFTTVKECMEHSRHYYYDICKWYLMFVGQWPYQKLKESLCFLTFILILDASALVTQIAKFVVCNNALCIYETLPPHMLTVMILVKIFTYQFNSRKIKDLTDRLFADWDILETKEEHDIMKKYAQNGRWYALIYGSYVYVSTISFATTSLVPRILDVVFPLNTSRPIMLAYPAYYFVDENRYFYYILLHMLTTSTLCMTGLIAHDSMFFVYVEHNCSLFAIVGFRFEHVSQRSNAKTHLTDCLNNKYVHKNVVFSIRAHRKALQFAKLLEDTFSISFAVQLLIVTIGLSITLVQLSTNLHDIAEAMRYFVFIIAQLFHLFCLSFQGQKLINHSLETCNKIYHGLWFTIPAKEQRLLLFVMRKSVEASILTAGKIYVFSLESFTTVVQSSMSYFTLLSSFDVS